MVPHALSLPCSLHNILVYGLHTERKHPIPRLDINANQLLESAHRTRTEAGHIASWSLLLGIMEDRSSRHARPCVA